MSMFDFKRKISHARVKLLGAEKAPPRPLPERRQSSSPQPPLPPSIHSASYSDLHCKPNLSSKRDSLKTTPEPPSLTSASSNSEAGLGLSAPDLHDHPSLTIERATPEAQDAIQIREDISQGRSPNSDRALSLASSEPPTAKPRPSEPTRRQSLVHNSNHKIIKTLLASNSQQHSSSEPPSAVDYFTSGLATNMASITYRKIWVKRQGGSATQVQIREDDLVDDVRDAILRKYGNSLGRTFDAPDVDIKIYPRTHSQSKRPKERVLQPDEDMCRTLDAFYPGGQTIDEALVICIPQRHTPHSSPGHHLSQHHNEDHHRPVENGNGYFPPMPATVAPSTHSSISLDNHHSVQTHDMARAMSVINTGQVPPLPSPGGTLRVHNRHIRPKATRQQTASPTLQNISAAAGSNLGPPTSSFRVPRPHAESVASDRSGVPNPPPLPTPPAPEAPPTNSKAGSTPPTPNGLPANRVASPDPGKRTKKRGPLGMSRRNGSKAHMPSDSEGHLPNIGAALSPPLIDSSVPPINCLIVEDNHINLKLLEAFMKRLKVRWQTAMNGQAAVTKWRSGGFHLVLMDIQLPIMSGLEATKEIRRLERVNGVGVLGTPGLRKSASQSSSDENGYISTNGVKDEQDGETPAKPSKVDESDQLTKSSGLFKSPVIIVALTASSLQSDRHEALAAGCNDFLTKARLPVNFVWLERKVKEWGCMQALIDFDGWRKWKDFAPQNEDANGNGAAKTLLANNNKNHTRKGSAGAKSARREKRRSDSSNILAPQLPAAMERFQVAEGIEPAATPERGPRMDSRRNSSERVNGVGA
ncbi:MAG: ssk1 response regulator receiver [Bathelium mastoideum]|nr:MAG: ssk1 response regulator receiver [Bathelium mastoideum]